MLQEIQYLEFFAGVGNVTKHMKLGRYRAARFDILDYVPNGRRKSNYMDLNSPSGYAFLYIQIRIAFASLFFSINSIVIQTLGLSLEKCNNGIQHLDLSSILGWLSSPC